MRRLNAGGMRAAYLPARYCVSMAVTSIVPRTTGSKRRFSEMPRSTRSDFLVTRFRVFGYDNGGHCRGLLALRCIWILQASLNKSSALRLPTFRLRKISFARWKVPGVVYCAWEAESSPECGYVEWGWARTNNTYGWGVQIATCLSSRVSVLSSLRVREHCIEGRSPHCKRVG